MIKALIFDFGGVLLRTEDHEPRKALAKKFAINQSELEYLVFSSSSSYQAMVGEISAFRHWQVVAKALNLNDEAVIDFRNQFFSGDRLDLNLVTYLQRMRKDYKIGLLSNAWDDLRSLLKEEFAILELFDAVIISAEVGLIKPDARIYQLAADKLSISTNQAIFIDDVAENVEAARNSGMFAIQFRSLSQIIPEINQIIGEQRNGFKPIND
ncbi:MAG: HAD family hydrolase [Anaerolineales bacterium]